MATIVERLLTASAPLVYLLVFLMPALEASLFVGFVFPGETVVLLGGVVASQHDVSLAAVIGLAMAGAIIGDSIGYSVGRRFGAALQRSRGGRLVGERRWRQAEDFLRRRGGPAVLLGRWTALLRALVPAAAGMAHLRYRTFLVWNVVGGTVWAVAIVLAGYLAGSAYRRVEHYIGRGAFVVLGVLAVAVVVRHLLVARRRTTSR